MRKTIFCFYCLRWFVQNYFYSPKHLLLFVFHCIGFAVSGRREVPIAPICGIQVLKIELLYLFSFCSWSVLPFVCSLFSFGLCIYVQSMGVEDVYLAVEAMKTAAKRAMWPVASYSVSFLLRLETLGNPIWSGKEVLEEFSRAV